VNILTAMVLSVPDANIVSPSCRLHEQHEVMIGSRNVFEPGLPLVGVPGMFLQDRFYLVDGLRVLLQKDLIGDGGGEHVAGNVPRNGGAGKGHDGG